MFACVSSESEYAPRPSTGREHWEDSLYVVKCRGCNVDFGMMTWKHHCRACGHVFCDQCTQHRLEVNRPHYASAEEKKLKRVCAQCFANPDETCKVLKSLKDPVRAHCPYLKREVTVRSLHPSEPGEPAALIGLPSVTVIGVGDGNFFFQPEEWSNMLGANISSKHWAGKAFDVLQLRTGARVWRGRVIVNRAGASCFGKRDSDCADVQWQIGDRLVKAVSSAKAAWKMNDTVQLGTDVSMFDDTILRLDTHANNSVSRAIEALNEDSTLCEQGLCIIYSSSQQQYYMAAAETLKEESLRLFEEARLCP